MKALRPHYLSLLLMALAGKLFAQEVPIFMEPKERATPLQTLPMNDPVIKNGAPVLNKDRQKEGWHWTDYFGTFTGYTRIENISKQLTVRPGAVVHLSKTFQSPVMTKLMADDEHTVDSNLDNVWVKVTFKKTVPVYYKKPTEKHAVATEAPSEHVPAKNEHLIEYYEGTLKKLPNYFGLQSKNPYALVNMNGEKIAYVNTQELVSTQSIDYYFDKNVTVSGIPEARKHGTPRIVVKAHTIHVKQ